MDQVDICEACVGKDKCPLCGAPIIAADNWGEDDWKCTRCTWVESNPNKILRPPDWDGDCGCEEAAFDKKYHLYPIIGHVVYLPQRR